MSPCEIPIALHVSAMHSLLKQNEEMLNCFVVQPYVNVANIRRKMYFFSNGSGPCH